MQVIPSAANTTHQEAPRNFSAHLDWFESHVKSSRVNHRISRMSNLKSRKSPARDCFGINSKRMLAEKKTKLPLIPPPPWMAQPRIPTTSILVRSPNQSQPPAFDPNILESNSSTLSGIRSNSSSKIYPTGTLNYHPRNPTIGFERRRSWIPSPKSPTPPRAIAEQA
jgi:hypothetical protein